MKKTILITLLTALSGAGPPVSASGSASGYRRDSVYRRIVEDGALTLACRFNYPQGSAQIDGNLPGNDEELSKLDEFIRMALNDSSLLVKKVGITGYNSIEGAYAVNERIARNRAKGFGEFLDKKYNLSARVRTDIAWVPEDWEKLYSLVSRSDLIRKAEVLDLIDQVDVFKGREEQLKKLDGGKVYRHMLTDFFPQLRRVEIRVEYDLRSPEGKKQRGVNPGELEKLPEQEKAGIRQAEKTALPEADTASLLPRAKVELFESGERYTIRHTQKNPLCHLCYPRFGIKTNLMNLAGFAQGVEFTTPLLNLSVEYFINPYLSLEAGASYSDWKHHSGKEFQGISGYRVEPRFWLPHSKSFSCIYVGIYGQFGDYNIRELHRDSDVNTHNITGDYVEAGLSIGCYIPLTLHWGLDIGVRGGYTNSKGTGYSQTSDGNMFLYNKSYNRMRLSAVILALTYRWGYKN